MTTYTPVPDFALDNLDTITHAEGGMWCDIKLPNGNIAKAPSGTPIRIKCLGTDSSTYREAFMERTRKTIADAKGNKNADAVVNDGIENSVAILRKLITSWEGFETKTSTKEKIEVVPLNEANVEAILRGYPLIRQQVDVFVSTQANFLA